MRNDQVIRKTCCYRPKSVNRKGSYDVIMMHAVNLYQIMINPMKSHQDRMRKTQVISVNTLFLSEISEAERL